MSRPQCLKLTKASVTFALVFAKIRAEQLAGCRTLLGPLAIRSSCESPRCLPITQGATVYGAALAELGCYLPDKHLTHKAVVALVTATRMAVSKALAKLRCAGLIEGRGATGVLWRGSRYF